MEPQQSPNSKIISAGAIIVLIIGAGYLLLTKYPAYQTENQDVSIDTTQHTSTEVVVSMTPRTEGVLPAPAKFPKEIPIETTSITESVTTQYPAQNAEQVSVSYKSSKSVAQKYAEYATYMRTAGYNIREGSANAPVKAIFGTKDNANISAVISSYGGQTLVQLSYLFK